MRIANVKGRLTIVGDRGGIDVETASNGRFKADPQAVYDDWVAFREWAKSAAPASAAPIAEGSLDSPAPRPRQVFGIGLNYRDHAAEANLPLPERPATFTKFPTCIAGAYADVELPSGTVDWEVELVAVIGVRAHRVAESAGWDHVAGSPSARIFPSVSSSGAPAASSRSASRFRDSGRSVHSWSRRTSSRSETTSRFAAP